MRIKILIDAFTYLILDDEGDAMTASILEEHYVDGEIVEGQEYGIDVHEVMCFIKEHGDPLE